MDSNSTRSRAVVARENHHNSPWFSSAELDALVEAIEAIELDALDDQSYCEALDRRSNRSSSKRWFQLELWGAR